MPALSSPWFHQTGQGPDLHGHNGMKSPGQASMSEAEIDELNKRLLRPTTSSMAKKSHSWKLDNTFMVEGRHSWAKMELFEDCKKCMWTGGGTVKGSCKIRPLKKTPTEIRNP